MSVAQHFSVDVLDHGRVELVDSMGDDLAIVQAAQSSFGRQSQEYGSREQGILRALMRDKHGVPFEHVVLKYKIKLPIFVARQLVKHRISSWSEHSGRYAQHEADFYVPTDVRTQTGKPMDYAYSPADEASRLLTIDCVSAVNHDAWETYQSLLEHGIAREQARLVLPQTLYTVITWTINVRSLLNVLMLRTDSHAQWEIQQYAQALWTLANYVIPDTLQAFEDAGRVAP